MLCRIVLFTKDKISHEKVTTQFSPIKFDYLFVRKMFHLWGMSAECTAYGIECNLRSIFQVSHFPIYFTSLYAREIFVILQDATVRELVYCPKMYISWYSKSDIK